MMSDRELEVELICEITDKSTKDAAILDLKRKWEREDSSSITGFIGFITCIILVSIGSYFLGGYYAQQAFVRDLRIIASNSEETPGDKHKQFYYDTWNYLYDKYKVDLN
jgi:hypothetical protein